MKPTTRRALKAWQARNELLIEKLVELTGQTVFAAVLVAGLAKWFDVI